MQTNKLSDDDASNYGTQLPPIVGDIVYEVEDDDQNNYEELSNHVAKFSNQPSPAAFRNIDRSSDSSSSSSSSNTNTADRQTTSTTSTTSYVNSNKWMDRLIGHKRYGMYVCVVCVCKIENLIERIVIDWCAFIFLLFNNFVSNLI